METNKKPKTEARKDLNSFKKRQDVHEDFHKFLEKLQNERIKSGKETVVTRISLWRLTKTISNLLNSNPELIKRLVEVDI